MPLAAEFDAVIINIGSSLYGPIDDEYCVTRSIFWAKLILWFLTGRINILNFDTKLNINRFVLGDATFWILLPKMCFTSSVEWRKKCYDIVRWPRQQHNAFAVAISDEEIRVVDKWAEINFWNEIVRYFWPSPFCWIRYNMLNAF